MVENDTGRYRAPALDKGLDILELLAAVDGGLSQAEIASALGRSANEIYRMLDRLVHRRYVRRTDGDRYELTLKMFEMAHLRPPLHRLVSQALPVMRRYANDTMLGCHLVVHDRNALVVIAQVDSPSYWRISVRVGSHIELLSTGAGHVFLAFATDEERAVLLETCGAVGDEMTPALRERLNAVAADGFERIPSPLMSGVVNLAVPIFGPVGTLRAALASPFLEQVDKHDLPDIDEALALLRKAGDDISVRHGIHP